jgi:hypothetical protein
MRRMGGWVIHFFVDVADNAVLIDDEADPHVDADVLIEHAVGPTCFVVGEVAQERELKSELLLELSRGGE